MEEILKQLLEGQKQLFEGQKQLFEGQKQIFEGQKQIVQRLDNLEGQVQENTNIIKAIEHRTEVLVVEVEGLKLTTAKASVVANLNDKVEILNSRQLQQEVEIQRLKAVNQ